MLAVGTAAARPPPEPEETGPSKEQTERHDLLVRAARDAHKQGRFIRARKYFERAGKIGQQVQRRDTHPERRGTAIASGPAIYRTSRSLGGRLVLGQVLLGRPSRLVGAVHLGCGSWFDVPPQHPVHVEDRVQFPRRHRPMERNGHDEPRCVESIDRW